jgi:hypothetical protein
MIEGLESPLDPFAPVEAAEKEPEANEADPKGTGDKDGPGVPVLGKPV